jgi:hypothetical protein
MAYRSKITPVVEPGCPVDWIKSGKPLGCLLCQGVYWLPLNPKACAIVCNRGPNADPVTTNQIGIWGDHNRPNPTSSQVNFLSIIGATQKIR